MHPAEAWKALIPNGGQQLLNTGMSNQRFLLVLDSKLKASQGLEVTSLPRISIWIMVENHLQFIGSPDAMEKLLFIGKKQHYY
jgi:hypothetical protein